MSYQQYFQTNKEQILDDLFTLLRFQTVSTESESQNEMTHCLNWLNAYLTELGFSTETWPTPDYPTLFAENKDIGDEKPTLLIYGHYDVQPADPLELWNSAPFEPEIRDGNIYARGVADNKGQLWFVLSALKAIKHLEGSYPLHIKLLIEGSEEKGSYGLLKVIKDYKEKIKADSVLLADAGFESLEKPALCLGCRGMLGLTLELTGANTDMHSGLHGGIIKNPNNVLTSILASLHAPDGSVAVSGFYDDITEVSDDVKEALNFSFDKETYQHIFGTLADGGEKEFSPFERAWLRPTIDINGVSGGYTAEGFKTVIPSKVMAKISARLVPGQDTEDIKNKIITHIKARTPADMQIHFDSSTGAGEAVLCNPASAIAKIAKSAFEKEYKKDISFIMIGGSVPIAADIARLSGGDMIFAGHAISTDCIHAPNEHFSLERFEKGFFSIINIIKTYASNAE